MGYSKTYEKSLFFEYLKNDFSQKEAAAMVKVSEKTAGVWAREYRTKLQPDAQAKELERIFAVIDLEFKNLKNLIQSKFNT